MIHVGHTMATPERSAQDAIALFGSLGLQGTELISLAADELGTRHGPPAGDAPIPSYEWPETDLWKLKDLAQQQGVPVITITPYVKNFNSSDEKARGESIVRLVRYMDFAARMGARFVRVYGGADGFGRESWPVAVASLKELAAEAGARGVTLLLENHPGTLTVTGEETARLVREVGQAALRILYDPANVLGASDEAPEKTFELQRDLIAYVHVKDFLVRGGNRMACPVGQGDVPWKEIMGWLKGARFAGPLSYEYERKWHRDQLPPPEEGLAESVRFIKALA